MGNRQQAGMADPPGMTASAIPSIKTPGAEAVAVNFLLAQDQQDKGLSPLATANGVIWVLPQAALTQADLRAVEPRRWDARNQAFVRFGFVPSGAEKLADLSRRYPGKIIVVTVGPHIVGLVRIDSLLNQGIIDMPALSEQQAIQIAEAVRNAPGR